MRHLAVLGGASQPAAELDRIANARLSSESLKLFDIGTRPVSNQDQPALACRLAVHGERLQDFVDTLRGRQPTNVDESGFGALRCGSDVDWLYADRNHGDVAAETEPTKVCRRRRPEGQDGDIA